MAAGILEEHLRRSVSESKALVVGAGGIGCELIKNLVLSGFQDLVIVRIIVYYFWKGIFDSRFLNGPFFPTYRKKRKLKKIDEKKNLNTI